MSVIEPHEDFTLAKSNERYHQIFNNSIDVIYLIEVTEDGRFVHLDINTAFTEAVGLPKEAIIGRYVDELEHKEFADILIEKYSSCLNAGEKSEYIGDYNFPSGHKTYHSTLSPIRDNSERIYRIVGIARDITQRKQNEERLHKSEEAFRTLTENNPDIIIRYDSSCRRTYVNPIFEKISGCQTDELIGKIPWRCSPLVAPQYFISELNKVIQSGISSVLEVAVFLPNGEMGWYTVSLTPEFNAHNDVNSVLCVARDITQAKQYESMLQKSAHMEQILSRMAANLPAFVYTLRKSPNGDTSFIYASSGIFTIFGLHPENVSKDITRLKALIHIEDLPHIENTMAASTATMSPCNITFRVQIPGHEERCIEAKATPKNETDSSGNILWHGVMLDVTK